MPPVELDSTAPPSPLLSIEEARIFQSVKSRLFDAREDPLRLGTYRLIRQLGVGGMGEVFLAHDDELDRPVALKLVHARLSHDGHFATRMRREARALAKLAHPNVVHVYEAGEHLGRVFIAMEYVEGKSLAEWIRDDSPSWRAILDAYLAAGEGLVAAHAAGLIHRDFKPDNVLRGADARVRVADFGLARAGGSGSETEPGGGPPSTAAARGEGLPTLDQRLSATGAVMGTPNYMPLEQVRGGVVDARSDQFAFCVALYEALWGQQPHDARSLGARDLVLAEDRPVVPPHGVVPGWLWPIVRRGLARDPGRRWPDMRSLLDQLRDVPVRRRTRQRATAAALGVSLALGGGWIGFTRSSAAALCTSDEAALVGVWDESRRLALRTAFAATGLALAGETATQVERSLDGWAANWKAEQAASCAATRIHGTQSAPMLDRRTVCLGQQRSEVAALVDVFAGADADVLTRAGDALRELPELGKCSIAALDAQAAPAVDLGDREAIEAGYVSLGQARVALNVGRTGDATALAWRARTVGGSLEHVPLALEARAVLARVAILRGELEAGLELLREVVIAAHQARLFDLAAGLRVELARAAAGRLADPRLERWSIDEAQLALDRLARPDDLRVVQLLTARGRFAAQEGELDAALAAHREAHALAESRLDDRAQVALLRVGIGTALYGLGKLKEARMEFEQSRVVLDAEWGPGTFESGRLDFNLAMIATDLNDFDVAEWHLESAIAIDEATWGGASIEVARDRFAGAYLAFARGEIAEGCVIVDEVKAIYEDVLGPVHDETAAALTAASLCRFYEGDFLAALAGYQRALAVQTGLLGPNHHEIALQHANIGEVLFALGEPDASLASHTRALALLDAAGDPTHPDLAPPLKGQALVWLENGEAERALAGLERALAVADASRAIELADIRFGLARALVAVHGTQERARALDLAREALGRFETAGLARQAGAVRAWIAGYAR